MCTVPKPYPREFRDDVVRVAGVLREPQLAHYVVGWPRYGDLGVVALYEVAPVGAAWVRLLPESDPSYGYVDAATPELAMGVVRSWRGHGIGSRLLDALIGAARQRGLASLSLSVETDLGGSACWERGGHSGRADRCAGFRRPRWLSRAGQRAGTRCRCLTAKMDSSTLGRLPSLTS
ncbi:N-acetyltransferase [Dietzia sp. oral taxon 368]|uniref:GNAT family N-acetyltransferase n=1 Tax=Dietzia sp. oral taxon 368 TaxID=712270 RepID=UPI000D08CC2C|nr:N-acetyltransferase [Dietzia sp. oral taxon 368]